MIRGSVSAALQQIPACLYLHRFSLRQQLTQLGKQAEAEKRIVQLKKVEQRIRQSIAIADRRASLPLYLNFPPELPVAQQADNLCRGIKAHPVIILCGETGSGKSTQLPKMCLQAGRGIFGRIAHTQPRRIAARNIAMRLAEEMQTTLGDGIGYKVRFSDQVSSQTRVKVLTDGMLLAELEGDRFLNEYDTIIIDEAHERSLNIDFLLGYLKTLLCRRPELKLIITSATIDVQRFSRHFDDAPVFEVSGRLYPVETRYRPLSGAANDASRLQAEGIQDAIEEAARSGPGDVLVFLPGEREIRETAQHLRRHLRIAAEILPLYARLSAAEQQKVFRTGAGRRVILATNVAETSLTVPGIHFVVDTGLARISRFSASRKIQRLPIEPISRAAANQRQGRCGRVASGLCFRLYDEADFLSRPEFSAAEISRTSLAAVILRLKNLRLGAIESFPFIDPPQRKQINAGYQLLQELGALDKQRQLTVIGRKLARLPVDPRLARMLLAANELACLSEMLVLAAGLSIQDPRLVPAEKQQAARQAHALLHGDDSDFAALLMLWQRYEQQRQDLSRRKLRQWCEKNFISARRMQEWQEVYRQLRNTCRELNLECNRQAANTAQIHQALLGGLLGNLACRHDDGSYLGSYGKKLWLFPGSGLFKKSPPWVMAAELVETSRLYGRTLARIKPEWIEHAAADLLQRSWFEPHWEKKRADVMAWEKVQLFGLVIVPRRKVSYSAIDKKTSRQLFIQRALVEGDFHCREVFFEANLALMDRVRQMENKTRRRDILVDEAELYSFYDERIPDDVCNGASFARWIKKDKKQKNADLRLSESLLMRQDSGHADPQRLPDQLKIGLFTFPLRYHFNPGESEDGISVEVPLLHLNQVSADAFSWLVPALLEEKAIVLIKGLPKSLRRQLAPVPDFVHGLGLDEMDQQSSLYEVLGRQVLKTTGQRISEKQWQQITLPAHLRFRFVLFDEKSREIDADRDLLKLQQRHGQSAQQEFRQLPVLELERDGLLTWDFDSLDESIEVPDDDGYVRGYPALVDQQDAVGISVFNSRDQAMDAHVEGLRRLFRLGLKEKIRSFGRQLPDLKTISLAYAVIDTRDHLCRDILLAVENEIYFAHGTNIRKRSEFNRQLQAAQDTLLLRCQWVCNQLQQCLPLYIEAKNRLNAISGGVGKSSREDIMDHLETLIYAQFLQDIELSQLAEYPRYLRAILLRIQRLGENQERDKHRYLQIKPYWQGFFYGDGEWNMNDEAVAEFRWLLEEYRVSLFAQELKTKVPVSEKRMAEAYSRLRTG